MASSGQTCAQSVPGLGHTVLPILEVDYAGLPDGLPPILAYESKWDPTSPYWNEIKYREAMARADELATLAHAQSEHGGARAYHLVREAVRIYEEAIALGSRSEEMRAFAIEYAQANRR